MKAVIWTRYGPPEVLQLQEVPKPIPKDGEVLVKILASTVTAGDCEMRSLKFPLYLSAPLRLYAGLVRPTRIRIPGMELSGVIEATGKGVTRFQPGDPVFGTPGLAMGAYAEFICLPAAAGAMEGTLAIKPENLSFDEAATVPIGGLEALHHLRKADLRPGQELLILGAGGSIGTYAVQLAKNYGVVVTGVDRNEKLELLRSIGADYTIDFTREDFSTSGKRYDVILDVAGKSSFSGCLRALKDTGIYLAANPKPSHLLQGKWASLRSGQKVLFGTANYGIEDLIRLKEQIEAGMIKPVIDRRYPLEQIVEAHRYVEAGHKKGNVAITVGEAPVDKIS